MTAVTPRPARPAVPEYRLDRWREAVARPLRADPGRTIAVVAAALVVAHLALRGWVAGQGFFYLDDYVFIARVVRAPLDVANLFTDHAGHLMPGSLVLVWLLTALVPLHWPAVVGVDIALQLAVDLAMLRLLVELFGRRLGVLLPFAVFTTTALTLPATIWWAAALNQLPMQLAVVLALTAHVRHLRSGRSADLRAAVRAVVIGLAFSEKTVLVLPLIAVITLVWFEEGPPPARLAALWDRRREAVLAYGVVGLAYGLLYLVVVPSPFRGVPDIGMMAALVGGQLTRAVLPGLLGGPWTWEYVPTTLPTAAVPLLVQVAAALAVAGVVAASLWAHRGAGPAWIVASCYLLVDAALVASSRAQVFDESVFTREYRYLTDLAVVAVLCLALAFLPVVDAPAVLRLPPQRALAWQPRRGASTRAVGRRPEGAALVISLLVAGSVVSGIGYATGWADNGSRPFIETARADLAARGATTLLADGPVPDRVMWSLLGPWTNASVLLAGAPEKPAFLVDGQTIGSLQMLDGDGHVTRAWVPPGLAAARGPVPRCGYPVARGPRTVALPGTAPEGRWLVRVSYLAGQDSAGWVSAGDQRRAPVLLPAGLHEFFVQVEGPVDDVTVEVRDAARPICLWQVEVGVPQVLPPGFR